MGTTTHNSLQITPKAGDILDKLVAGSKLPKKHIVEVVFEWLEGQDEIVRGIILQQIPASLHQAAARRAMEHLADPTVVEVARSIEARGPGAVAEAITLLTKFLQENQIAERKGRKTA